MNELLSLRFNIVSPLSDEKRGAHVSIKLSNSENVARKLKEKEIIAAPRKDILRISTHVYNTQRDIDYLISSLTKL